MRLLLVRARSPGRGRGLAASKKRTLGVAHPVSSHVACVAVSIRLVRRREPRSLRARIEGPRRSRGALPPEHDGGVLLIRQVRPIGLVRETRARYRETRRLRVWGGGRILRGIELEGGLAELVKLPCISSL